MTSNSDIIEVSQVIVINKVHIFVFMMTIIKSHT